MTKRNERPYDSVLDTIGWTPMIRLTRVTKGIRTPVLAQAAALRGYRCIFTMPDKMSQEKVRLLKAFGAEVIVTPTAVPPDHPDHYLQTAKRIAEETPNAICA